MAEFEMSTDELVNNNVKPAKITQYIAALSATMGALCFGTILGYTSPAKPLLVSNSTSANDTLLLSDFEFSWFSSSVNLGALVGGPVGGLCINIIGRRGTMLATGPFYLGSWALIAFGQNYAMLLIGRIIGGLCTGMTCIAAPTFIGEFASADVRGLLGSCFQLMVVTGILYSYVFGAIITESWRGIAGVCAIPSVLYFLLVFITKESPSYLLSKGKEKEASDALQYFRGKGYNIQPEMETLKASLEESRQNKTKFSDLKESYIMRPLMIALALMFFQQLSGVNAVLFNLTTIFEDAGTGISGDISSIIVGVAQVLATAVAGILMDKAGRKILLIISASVMMISLVVLGVFFFLKEEEKDVSSLGWLPITSLIIFIVAFSIGYGPIPWLMMGELFSANVREAAGSLSTLMNWMMSFIVTLLFDPLQSAINNSGVYWLFAAICALNLAFAVLLVPETKGKTLQEISAFFGGPTATTTNDSQERKGSDASSLGKMRY